MISQYAALNQAEISIAALHQSEISIVTIHQSELSIAALHQSEASIGLSSPVPGAEQDDCTLGDQKDAEHHAEGSQGDERLGAGVQGGGGGGQPRPVLGPLNDGEGVGHHHPALLLLLSSLQRGQVGVLAVVLEKVASEGS